MDFFYTFFFGSGGGMRRSGPMRLPPALTSGLTCEREPGRGERVGVCVGGEGALLPPPSPPSPLDLSLPSSLWLFLTPGQYFQGGEDSFS